MCHLQLLIWIIVVFDQPKKSILQKGVYLCSHIFTPKVIRDPFHQILTEGVFHQNDLLVPV